MSAMSHRCRLSGGVGAYTYSVGGDFAVSADGLLRLALAQSNVATLTATVTIDDEHADTTPINGGYTLLVVDNCDLHRRRR